MSLKEHVRRRLVESAELKKKAIDLYPEEIEKASKEITKRLRIGGKIFACGNGGSSCDAQHIVGELMVRFYKNRPPIPAIALGTNVGVITAISNDFSYNESFSRSVEGLMNGNDVLIALSTSGNSPNVLSAVNTARAKGSWILGFSGRNGDKMASLCDQIFLVPSDDTPRIQEIHITVAHILCELIEMEMYG